MSVTRQKEEQTQGGAGLTKKAALIVGANLLSMCLAFILPLVVVRTLNQAEFGLYKQAFQIMLSALGLLNLQVAVSVFYFMAREPEKKLQVVLNIVIFYSLVGSLIFLIFLIWPGWVTLIFKGSELVPYVPLLGLAILFWLVSTNLESVPIAAGDVRIASAFIILSQFTKSAMIILAVVIFGDITAILIAAVLQGAVQTAVMIIYIRRKFGRFLATVDWPLFRVQIGNALPFGIGGIVAIVQNDMHNYFVSHYFDTATYAIYAVGCFQLPLLGMLATSFASVLNPELAKHKEAADYQAIIHLWMDVMRKLAFFYLPGFALMFVLRQDLITVLFRVDYLASVPIFAINLFGLLLGLTVHLHVLRLFDQLRYFRLKLYLVLIPITLGALHLGLISGGLFGVAVAVVCVQTLDVGITLAKIARELGMTRHDLLSLKPLLRIGAAAAASLLVTFVARHGLMQLPSLRRLIAGAAIFGMVYLITIFMMGAVKHEEQVALREMVSRYYAKGATRLRFLLTTD
ncbi:MAG: oligosaccharide flippase family protein [Acidobacteria bacterium]|nr:oligosaccharide flippase family protein [Acidobacteriota bacterium]